MRMMLFMSRMIAMVIVMLAVLLAVFVFLDAMRQGPNARGLLLGSDVWHDIRHVLDAAF